MSYIIKHVTIKRKNTRDCDEHQNVRRKTVDEIRAVLTDTYTCTKTSDTPAEPADNFLQKNKTWVVKCVCVLLFFATGVAFYHFHQGWSVVTCLYFIVVSMTTVGYGDISPSDDWARLFTIFFILFGLVFVFSIINDAIQSFLDHLESQAMEKLEEDEVKQSNHVVKIGISVGVIFLFLMLGTLFYSYNEGWTFIQGLYWTCMTVSTVGYGDLELKKFSSKIFSIFYIVFAVVLMTTAIGNFAAVQMELAHEKKKLDMLNTKLDIEAIRAMDKDGKGVDEMAFVTAMLVQICGLDKEKDIDPWRARFRELDKDDSKYLDEEDLRLLEQEEEKKRQERLAAYKRKSVGETHALFSQIPTKSNHVRSPAALSPNKNMVFTIPFFESAVVAWNGITSAFKKKSRPAPRKIAVVKVKPGGTGSQCREHAEMKLDSQV